jgi:thiol-disulfide isomerase/thioredoxin
VEAKAFENVKNQIGYCGIWCGSCIVGNGTLKELSKKYAFILEGYGIDKWGADE